MVEDGKITMLGKALILFPSPVLLFINFSAAMVYLIIANLGIFLYEEVNARKYQKRNPN